MMQVLLRSCGARILLRPKIPVERSILPVLYSQKSSFSTGGWLSSPQNEPQEKAKASTHFKTSATKELHEGDEPGDLDSHRQDGGPSQKFYPHHLPHPIWSEKEMNSVEITHHTPGGIVDWMAYAHVMALRYTFDLLSGFLIGQRTEKKWLNRVIFLETVAGVPGMVAGMTRHLHSLRRLRRDHGWIHTLLEEAENERMHLISALMVKQPNWLFRGCVLIAQGIFVNFFFVAYLISPRYCHRFVGYLEEEAVKTYTKLLQDIDTGALPKWTKMRAPDVAIHYWNMHPNASMKDMFRAIRADEAHHREVNHTLSSMKPYEENPYKPGE